MNELDALRAAHVLGDITIISEPEPPKCCCSHGGKPYMLEGFGMVVNQDPSCRIHRAASRYVAQPAKLDKTSRKQGVTHGRNSGGKTFVT